MLCHTWVVMAAKAGTHLFECIEQTGSGHVREPLNAKKNMQMFFAFCLSSVD